MSTFNRIHERRVEKLAQAVERCHSYDQSKMQHACGSPACLLGWADALFPDSDWAGLPFLFGEAPADPSAYEVWDRNWYGPTGCDNAGRSGKKAAAYIRKMSTDLKAALAAAKKQSRRHPK